MTPALERRDFGSLRLRGRVWWLRYRVNGREHWESARTASRREAEKLLARRQAELGLGVLVAPDVSRVTADDLWQMIRDDYRVRGRRSAGTLEDALRHLEAHFRGARALAITTDRVTAYERARLDAGAARATVNKELAALRRAFNLAVRARRLPLSARPAIATPDPRNARQGFFEEADFRRVLAALPVELQPLMEFYYLTGWRKQEALQLTWDRVDFAAGIIRLEVNTTKNGDGRAFPFDALPALQQLLVAQRARTTQLERATGAIVRHVFHRGGRPVRSYDAAWREACRRAAVQTSATGVEMVVRPGLLGRHVHDFRRTAVRNLERAGVSHSVGMRLTGHKTDAVYRRYAIVAEQDLREAVAKLARGTTGGQSALRVVEGGR